jgi:hypothetical protein
LAAGGVCYAAERGVSASATRAGAHDARPDGTMRNRISAAVSGRIDRSRRSTPAARSKILGSRRCPDSPLDRCRRRKPCKAAAQHAGGDDATARGDGSDPARWRDSAGWPATATNGGLPGDRLRCNNAPLDGVVGKAAHNPSTSKGAVGETLWLAWAMNTGSLKVGPREVLLPKVKPRREAPTSRRDVFMRSNLLPAVRGGIQVGYRSAGAKATAGTLSPRSTRRGGGPLRAPNWYPLSLRPTHDHETG